MSNEIICWICHEKPAIPNIAYYGKKVCESCRFDWIQQNINKGDVKK